MFEAALHSNTDSLGAAADAHDLEDVVLEVLSLALSLSLGDIGTGAHVQPRDFVFTRV